MTKKYDKDSLLEIGFEEIAHWRCNEGGTLFYEPINRGPEYDVIIEIKNALYAFAIDSKIKYIGKTASSIKKRFKGYCVPGKKQSTNIKCNGEIHKLLNENQQVSILVFTSDDLLKYGDYIINLAAGLEDNLIEAFKPEWNRTGNRYETESAVNEEIAESSPGPSQPLPTAPPAQPIATGATPEPDWKGKPHFTVDLMNSTPFEEGTINVPSKKARWVGAHDEMVQLFLGGIENTSIDGRIYRKATSKNSPRIHGRKKLAEWFQSNFKNRTSATVYIVNRNNLFLPLPESLRAGSS